jgi:hypothetical protein
MKKIRHYLALMATLMIMLVGCLGHLPPHYDYTHHVGANVPQLVIPVYLDVRFSPDDMLSIGDAVAQWNYALNGYIELDIQSKRFDMEPEIIANCMTHRCWMVMQVDSSNYMVTELDDLAGPGSRTLAWANDVGGNRMFLIRDRLKTSWIRGIVLHEMGHLLGAEHDNAYLMAPEFVWEDTQCVDYQTIRLVGTYWSLPVNELNYCVYSH